FKGANLQEAVLVEANFQQANLVEANLQKAALWEADLRGASFWYSWLTDTALVEAKENARTNLQSAQGWETAKYDPEIREWLGLPPETLEAE
ncbi:MAG: pentapeptide repeat-containing protein, partial [Verrucomicrobia bacterium]|nr:pentapeptide repeat-containing protein [Leptolyngbya sp. ES-bin-22]